MADSSGMSFFLDREGHKKILKVASNQELQTRNQELTTRNQELKEKADWLELEVDAIYQEKYKAERDVDFLEQKNEDLKVMLETVCKQRDYLLKVFGENVRG